MRTLAMLVVVMAGVWGQPEKKEEFVQWADPPGELTEAERALVERAKRALEAGDVSGVLVDPAYMPVHARTEFRNQVKKHAKEGPLTIAGKDEPGTRLSVELEFVDKRTSR